jgi:hypothetical protein
VSDTQTTKPTATPAPSPCLCGCGAPTVRPAASFVAGHDARLVSELAKAALASGDRDSALATAARVSAPLQTKLAGVLATADRRAADKRDREAKAADKATAAKAAKARKAAEHAAGVAARAQAKADAAKAAAEAASQAA